MRETEGARIRAGIKWAEKGEKCNSYFLSLEAQKARNDTIFRIANKQGTIIKENDSILEYLASHYESLYMQPPIPQQEVLDEAFCIPDPVFSLSDEEAESLEGAITEAELHRTVSSMKNGSAPGMDGIPAEVYKMCWLDIK